MNVEEMRLRSLAHRENPEPGDFWHEMLVPYFVVLAVGAKDVLVCEKIKVVDDGHWTWDLGYTVTLSREKFYKEVSYNSRDKQWDATHTCADVSEKPHMWAVEKWRNSPTVEHTYRE